jgi:hypothetical protein
MRGNGVALGLVVLFIICQLPLQVDAGRSDGTDSWQNGLKFSVFVENNDFWTTNSVSEIFFVLTLLDAGSIIDFKTLIFEITLVTETNYTGEFTVIDPWNAVGDQVRIVGQFTLKNEDVNNAGWDIYMGSFYYNYSVIADTTENNDIRFYTHVNRGTPLSISTFSFIVFWPFPPIILMTGVFWVAYFGLKRFNKRYEGLEEKTSSP